MATVIEALINPGPFKGSRKDPEKLLVKFNLYIEQIENFMLATDTDGSSDKRKLALLQAVGGTEMIALFKHVGKVKLSVTPAIEPVAARGGLPAVEAVAEVAADTFLQAVQKIRTGILGQTNQTMTRYKLFQELPQDGSVFAEWWPKLIEQAERCDWSNYDAEMAARDAMLFQTSNKKLKKKMLAENLIFSAAVKFGLTSEQSERDAVRTETGDGKVDRVRKLEEQVARLQFSNSVEQCQTCSRKGGHSEGYSCPGLKVECFDCHKRGHFRKAPVCEGPNNYKSEKKNKKKQAGNTPGKQVRKISSGEESTESSLSSEAESINRIEIVSSVDTEKRNEQKANVSFRARKGGVKIQTKWTVDSGVSKTLLAEEDWEKLKSKNSSIKLKKNRIKFKPYGTNIVLPVIGRAKVVLQCQAGAQVKTMVYVVRDQKESLLGRRDGQKLGIISIKPEGKASEQKIRQITSVSKEKLVVEDKVEANMEKLKVKFQELFREGIGEAEIEPIKIYAKPGIKPVAQRLRTVPLHYMKPLKEHIDLLLKEGVIEGPLGSEEASKGWVHNVVITLKGWDSTKIRMNLDTRPMAEAVKTVHFPIPTPEQLRHQFAGSDKFSVIDLNHAFHQFPICEDSRNLYKFTTPFGLFRFRRLVMGTPPASGECHTKLAAIISGLEGVCQIKDDIVVHGKQEQHDERLEKVFQRLMKYKLTLRPEKCKLGKPEVRWFGNIYSKQGMSPDPEKVEDIKAWTAPKDKSEVKSFLQTIQFVSTYMRVGAEETYADITLPLRKLTGKGVRFKWTEDCGRSFERLKELLSSDTVLMSYEPTRKTRLYVDHGPSGLASSVCQQYHEPGQPKQWRMVTHKSRSLQKAELNYEKIEGESLGVLWGIKAHAMYLYGTKFEVIVDHQPLVPHYNNVTRPAPCRVARHRSKLRNFNFHMTYEPGKTTPCDFGSRHPPPPRNYTQQEREEQGVEEEEEDAEVFVARMIEETFPEAVTLEEVRKEIEKDKILSKLKEDVKLGKLRKELKHSEYGQIFGELTLTQGVLLKGDKLIIPAALQADCIALAHEGHLGEEKTIQNIRSKVWFPRLAMMSKDFVKTCNTGCAPATPANAPPPLAVRDTPEGPWKVCAADYKGPIGGRHGYYFHVLIDTYSRWPEVAITSSTSFQKLFPVLDRSFDTHGIPEKIVHDNGPPYDSTNWRAYARKSGFKTDPCTPEHPQANGMAEKFMASIVKLTHAAIAERKDPKTEISKFLLNYRNTPHPSTGVEPSKLMMNRQIRTKLPAVIKTPDTPEHRLVRQKDREMKIKQKTYADKHRRAQHKKVKIGDEVLIQQQKTTVHPPFDPDPFVVTEVRGTKVEAKRKTDGKV